MSMRYPGGVISATADTPSSTSASGVWNLEDQMQAQAAGNWPAPFTVSNSLRIRKSVSANLTRTPASASNRKTWTWSGWVKRGALDGNYQALLEVWNGNNNNQCINITWGNDDTIFVSAYSVSWRTSTPVYRDPSAWYHIVVTIDTTQATAANRVKIYVNNSQITSFSTSTDPSLNDDLAVNQAATHYLGSGNSRNYSDGYLAEINFVDGQALTPSSFGTTDPTTGVWTAQKYSGTYGTNGYYLPFSDTSALTTSSNTGLGKDFSGNGNYWATNNISITSGATYDAMKDVPAPISSTVGNYAVMNPLQTTNGTFTNGNLSVSISSPGTTIGQARGTFAPISGKWYWEQTITTDGNQSTWFGVVPASTIVNANYTSTAYNQVLYARYDGSKNVNGTSSSYGASYTTGDVIGVALDLDGGTVTFYKNNTSQGSISLPTTGVPYQPVYWWSSSTSSGAANFNFGQQPFTYTAPSGYLPLNTNNLATPAIVQGNQYFAPTIYTGNGSSQTISVGFQPAFTWAKARSAAYINYLFDAVRGATKYLISNATDSEYTGDTAFASNGFALTSDINAGGVTYASWNWKGSSNVTNTTGSVTSTVNANTASGVSIVTFTSPSGTGNFSVGHGLGATPSMVIVKASNTTGVWYVYHSSLATDYYLRLNSTNAAATDGVQWGAGMTSSVIGLRASYSTVPGAATVAYAFAPVSGFSAFGSYTGNGSSDGPFIYTGFRPAYVMVKRTSSTGDWPILDNARDTYNVEQYGLYANTSGSETNFGSPTPMYDFVSNGFKIRNTYTNTNASGSTYIYMAFAENPFKYALAR